MLYVKEIKSKRVLLAGGSGFLGRSLEAYFTSKGAEVKILTRRPKASNEIYWDASHPGDWWSEIEWADVVINLTGKSVNCRYTQQNREEILSSRLNSTAVLAQAIQQANHPPLIWLNAGSATIYTHAEQKKMTEDDGWIGDDFSMYVCRKWEEKFYEEDLEHTRRVALRTSIVLGKYGGAYPAYQRLVKWGMGGAQGKGQQWMSWIHEIDFCRAVEFIITHPDCVGSLNITAPYPVKNKVFMELLRKLLNRTAGLRQPVWLLEIGAALMGTETELLLKSRNVIPEKLLEKGFEFKYERVNEALENLVKKHL